LTTTHKRIASFIAGALVGALGAWIAGFVFNERGGNAVGVYLVVLMAGGAFAFPPGDLSEKE
jgi:hypothetical protein